MIYGLYLSSQGAEVQTARQEVLANNLANASTTAFKRDLLRFQSHRPFDVRAGNTIPDEMAAMPGGVTVADSTIDFAPATLLTTKGPLDVALADRGFFKVTDGKKTYLTRDGEFSLNARGDLVTKGQGLQVLGVGNNPINGFDGNAPLQIDADGTIHQGEDVVGQLQVVEPEEPRELQKAGRNLYVATGRLRAIDPENVTVRQGYLEGSSVSPVSEMMQLIETSRAFEANINMIKHQDDALGRLLSSLPRK